MSNKARKIVLIVGCVIMICGVVGLLYPFVGNCINKRQQASIVQQYQDDIVLLRAEEIDEHLKAAIEYNESLVARTKAIAGLTDEELEKYNNMLDVSISGIMGYIDIPKINATLPIYHGTSESVLQSGIGHLEGSSLPVGGPGTHAVLTGHSGLPESDLFTHLDELEKGDKFTVTVLNNKATYEVYDISVVLPEDVLLEITPDKDFCTLITCTPIGVNTHRLVIRGVRVEDNIQRVGVTAFS